jgi:phospho-N-acetylmuramoyl-pentapeptide-transferase
MVPVLIAGFLALIAAIVVGPKFIETLRARNLGQQIREEGPKTHVVKQGTPTMGGLLIVGSAVLPFLALSRYTIEALTVLFILLGCAAIGFTDDYLKLRRRHSLGLPGRWKMVLLVAVTVGAAILLSQSSAFNTNLYVPVVSWQIHLGGLYYPFLFVVIAGTVNGVNLTDGIDGLAAGTGIIALVSFTAINVLTYIRTGSGDPKALDLAILGGALVGASIGFLWFNAFPAEVFMGDTGAMAIGGALAGFAVFSKTEVLLLVVGGIFLIEALSVILQVATFKFWGRRMFLMAPIHHHFEMKAWSETKIMVRFWIVAAILAAGAFAIYYQYYFDFHP